MYNYSQLLKLSKLELINILVRDNIGSIKNPQDSNKFFADFSGLVKDWHKEHFIVLALNTKNVVIHAELVSMGHLSASLVHPREVFKNVVCLPGVSSIIIGHNHPSGDPLPSPDDEEVTRMIKQGADFLGIPLLDHVIFTKFGKYYSFNEKNNL